MTDQKHIIRRQVIELEIPSGMNGIAIQERVSRIFHDSLVRIIDRHLGELSAPSSIDKIPYLELDLGHIHVNDLEVVMAEKIEQVFRERVPASFANSAISTGRNDHQEKRHESDLDLVEYFLATGSFPWWAREATLVMLEKALENIIQKDAFLAKKLLTAVIRESQALKRLIYTFSDRTLGRLFRIMHPGRTLDEVEPDRKLFYALKTGNGQFRQQFWQELLKAGVADKTILRERFEENFPGAERPESDLRLLSFIRENIERIDAIISKPILSKDGQVILEALLESQNALLANRDYGGEVSRHLKEQEALKETLSRLRRLVHETEARVSNDAGNAMEKELDNLLRQIHVLTGRIKAAAVHEDTLAQKGTAGTPSNKNKINSPFSDADKIYIKNAGLVLLWPFLNRFFCNIGFADAKEFVNAAAAEKACLILQHLVAGSFEELFEAQLPLNKVLCGIDLEHPVDTSVTEIEPVVTEAGEHLLRAVIQNGPLWKELSLESFRRAYLQREGALTTRDGNWLLQVKRETYDVIVDRLPWTIQVVKLPWMKHLMYVEWQQK